MSIIQRIKSIWTRDHTRADAVRADAQSALPGELSDYTTGKTAPFDWVSDLSRLKVRDHSNPDHRETMTELQPCAKLWVRDIATTVFDNWFVFVDMEGKPREDMDVVQEKLKALKMEEVLKRACIEERKHGWAIIFKVYEGNRLKSEEDREKSLTHYMGDYHAFTDTPAPRDREILWVEPVPTKCIQMLTVDEWNRPEIIRYISKLHGDAPSGGKAVIVDLHASRCWFIVPRPKDRHWEGYTALTDIWLPLVALNEHLDNMTWYAGKVGFYKEVWKKKGALDDAAANAMIAAQTQGGKRRFEMIQDGVWDEPTMLAPPVAASAFGEQIDKIYEIMSSGTGLSTARWKGAQAGELEGSRTNLKLERAVISSIQDSYEPILRAIIEDLFPAQFTDYYFEWEASEQFDEMEKAEVLQVKAQAISQLATICSVEELREMAGLKGTPEGKTLAEEQQESLKDLARVSGAGSQKEGGASAARQNTPAPQPTRADAQHAAKAGTFPEFVAYWREQGWSNKRLISQIAFGRSRFYDLLNDREVQRVDLHL